MPVSRSYIPDEWAERIHCPFCDIGEVTVEHQNILADTMRCHNCGLSFEIEDGGNLIFVVILPDDFSREMSHRWYSIQEVKDFSRQELIQPTIPSGSTKDQPVGDKELFNLKMMNARKLFEMGNDSTQIHSSLVSTGQLSKQQIAEIMAEIDELKCKRQARQINNLIGFGMVGMSVFLLIVFVFIFFQRNQSPGIQGKPIIEGLSEQVENDSFSDSQQQSQPDKIDIEKLPEQIQALIPAGVSILAAPTPGITVEVPSGSLHFDCPGSKLEASSLFGGNANDWTQADIGRGWVMIATQPTTIMVPEFMSAGYLEFQQTNLEMKSVSGPVTLTNIYMISISCE